MKLYLKTLWGAIALLALGSVHTVWADYPTKPVQIVVPFAPGGAVDILTRKVAEKLTAQKGYNVVVENKPGAGGGIAAASVARAAPDGYTLLMGTTNTHGINSYLYDKLQYDPIKDFSPVGMVADNVVVLLAGSSFPANTLSEAVAEIKKHPGTYSYASPGAGTVHHLSMEMLKQAADLDVIHAPYRGAGVAMTDLVAGHVPLMVGGIAPAMGFIQEGKVKVLGYSNTRDYSNVLPKVQKFSEISPNVGIRSWIGLLAPAGTPENVVQKLNKDLNSVLQDAALNEDLTRLGMTATAMSAQEFGQLIKDDMPVWQQVVQSSGARQ